MEFPSNSHNAKSEKLQPKEQPKKEIQKVISGEAIKKPKPVGRKFKDIFIGGEFKNAIRYISSEVLLPALKNMVVDATSRGIERVVYGESSPRRRGPLDQNRPKISYNQPVDRYRRVMLPDQPPYSPTHRRRHDVGDIIMHSRQEAETVLERLIDIIEKFDVASVADLHDLVGLPSTYVDNKWGWSHLANVSVRQIREGYYLDLPPVEPI